MPQLIHKVHSSQSATSFIKKIIAEETLKTSEFDCNNKIKFLEQILEYHRIYDLWPDTFIYDELLHKEFMNYGLDEVIKHVANLVGQYNYVLLSMPRCGKSESKVFKRLSTIQLAPEPDPFERRRPGDQ